MESGNQPNLQLLRELGSADPVFLGAGMEGEVYRVGPGRIAKVWHTPNPEKLERLAQFYTALEKANLSFGTPQIEHIFRDGSALVSFEREWEGRPLRIDPEAEALPDETLALFIQVLSELRGVSASAAMRDMPVLDEQGAFWTGASSFAEALCNLLTRRTRLYGDFWRRAIPNFDDRFAALQTQLLELPPLPDAPLHGDLFGENVLMDAQGRLSAVLDFSVFSTSGDPRFDAAVCAAILNMSGPAAAQIMRQATAEFAGALGYDTQALRLYQAAYALATSNLYSPEGQDGHFAWCIRQWQKPELLALF